MIYKGVPLNKRPDDLEAIKKIILKVRPDIIVECGTQYGGSALFYADLVDSVITIDIKDQRSSLMRNDKRIIFLEGDSLSEEIIKRVKELVKGKKVILNLDSEHNMERVFGELKAYSSIVSSDSYIIVEDTFLDFTKNLKYANRYPQGGPYRGILEFLKENKKWEIDREAEAATTINPYGYLKRIK